MKKGIFLLLSSVLCAISHEMSQTEAFIADHNFPFITNYAQNKPVYANIIKKVLTYGKQHAATHYEFFHAQTGTWRIYQDVFKELYERKVNKNTPLKEFEFFRYTVNDPYYSQFTSAADYLIKTLLKKGIIDDMGTDRNRLLSVNLSLFSNTRYEGESTWHYFVSNKSWTPPSFKLLEELLISFGINPKWAKDLLLLSEMLKTPEGSLFQILIPKNIVDTFVYLSWSRGIPFDEELLSAILAQRTHPPRPKIKTIVTSYNKKWASKDPETVKLIQSVITHIKEQKYKPSTFLNTFKIHPKQLAYYDIMQARILITNTGLLNPFSGIKIKRYSTLAAKQEALYKKKLQMLIEAMLSEPTTTSINKTAINEKIRTDETILENSLNQEET